MKRYQSRHGKEILLILEKKSPFLHEQVYVYWVDKAAENIPDNEAKQTSARKKSLKSLFKFIGRIRAEKSRYISYSLTFNFFPLHTTSLSSCLEYLSFGHPPTLQKL